jgi:hypothetical protein
MSSNLSLANELSPMAQTFRVQDPAGAVLTSVGLYFSTKPGVDDLDLPVTVELRPVTESGFPSSYQAIPNTRTARTRSTVSANSNFTNATETRFTFPSPVYVPGNVEVALVVYTNNTPGKYKVWLAELGEFYFGRTDKRITSQPALGSFFKSSNGTTWSSDQTLDLAFNVYQADFGTSILTTPAVAALEVDTPPVSGHISNPFSSNNGSNTLFVNHFDHGFQAGDTVRVYGLDSADTSVGIPNTEILGSKTIADVDPYGYTITTSTNANDSDRFGGDNILTTAQYPFDAVRTFFPKVEPVGTSTSIKADFVTHKSWGSGQVDGVASADVKITDNDYTFFDVPYVVRSEDQEGGTPSALFKMSMSTNNRYVAPHLNWVNSSVRFGHNLIDNDNTSNYITTFKDHVGPENATDNDILAQHIAKPVFLSEELSANSIKILIDVDRPNSAAFNVWYRTGLQSEGSDALGAKDWNKFNRNPALPDYSTYLTNAPSIFHNDYKEYAFFKQNIPDFDVVQIKITMSTTNSAYPPVFRNLRTIATI